MSTPQSSQMRPGNKVLIGIPFPLCNRSHQTSACSYAGPPPHIRAEFPPHNCTVGNNGAIKTLFCLAIHTCPPVPVARWQSLYEHLLAPQANLPVLPNNQPTSARWFVARTPHLWFQAICPVNVEIAAEPHNGVMCDGFCGWHSRFEIKPLSAVYS
jgi:hypothetical protein